MADIERSIPGEPQGPKSEPHSTELARKAQEKEAPNIDLKQALGASRVIPLSTRRITTPFDLWAIHDEILSHRSSEDIPPQRKD